jgi:hypothetical protein
MTWLALALTLTLDVDAASLISDAVVRRAFEESAAIWRSAGVTLQSMPGRGATSADPFGIRVLFGEARGTPLDSETPFGWIVFDAGGTPERVIHLSYPNVLRMIEANARYRDRSRAEQEILLGRALGRALAHELGHYVLASKHHSSSGLMRGRRSVDEFFLPSRTPFGLAGRDRDRVAARLQAEPGRVARIVPRAAGPPGVDECQRADLDVGLRIETGEDPAEARVNRRPAHP